MDDLDYLSLVEGQVSAARRISAGSVAYLARFPYPVLCYSRAHGDRSFLDLGGAQPLMSWSADEEDGSAWILPAFRIEVDPSSIVEAQYESTRFNHAFRQGDRTGIIGIQSSRFGRPSSIAIDSNGSAEPLTTGEYKLFFSRWRLVVISDIGEAMLIDHTAVERASGRYES